MRLFSPMLHGFFMYHKHILGERQMSSRSHKSKSQSARCFKFNIWYVRKSVCSHSVLPVHIPPLLWGIGLSKDGKGYKKNQNGDECQKGEWKGGDGKKILGKNSKKIIN